MKQGDKEELKKILKEQLKDLIAKADGRVAGLISTSIAAPEIVEHSALDYYRGLSLRISDREIRLIRKIQQALNRIEEDAYGICDLCEKEISIPRLKARPVTTLCIACKTKQESFEKAAGF
jgi:RNA polymerase-binding transcription factor